MNIVHPGSATTSCASLTAVSAPDTATRRTGTTVPTAAPALTGTSTTVLPGSGTVTVTDCGSSPATLEVTVRSVIGASTNTLTRSTWRGAASSPTNRSVDAAVSIRRDKAGPSDFFGPSALDCSSQVERAAERLVDDEIEDDDGQRVEDRVRRQLPVQNRAVLPEEREDAHRGRLLLRAEQQDERHEKVAPSLDEREDADDGHPGKNEGHDDVAQRLHLTGPVDPGRLFQSYRHPVDEVLGEEDGKRQGRRRHEEHGAGE